MNQLSGIKSVDFDIQAYGHGVVNWNGKVDKGSTIIVNGQTLKVHFDNHTVPKIRNGEMYIGSNCIRHFLFCDEGNAVLLAEQTRLGKQMDEPLLREKLLKMLGSSIGLVRGYMETVAGSGTEGVTRNTALQIMDFKEQLGNVNPFEQMTCAYALDKDGNKDSNSIFSKTTYGDTAYTSYGSLSIEQLQFISLAQDINKSEFPMSRIGKERSKQVKLILKSIVEYLNKVNDFFDLGLNPNAEHGVYQKRGQLVSYAQEGILLNDDAVDCLVRLTLYKLSNFNIQKSSAYMQVSQIKVAYNESIRRHWFKENDDELPKTAGYAQYFEKVAV